MENNNIQSPDDAVSDAVDHATPQPSTTPAMFSPVNDHDDNTDDFDPEDDDDDFPFSFIDRSIWG